MNQPKDVWGPRKCPRCGAEPDVYCRTVSGARAGLPHRERWPEGPPRVPRSEAAREAKRRRDGVLSPEARARRDREREERAARRERERLAKAQIRAERQAERVRSYRHLSKDDAIKALARDRMREWRERRAA